MTGTLHIGHALNMTIQDILARYWIMVKMFYGLVLTMQNSYSKNCRKNLKDNLNKTKRFRKEKLEEVWNWKEKSGSKIINQIKRLGATRLVDLGLPWIKYVNAVRYTFNNYMKRV